MDKIRYTAFIILLLLFIKSSWSELSFSGIETISVTGNFQSGASPAPCFTDWNGDGKTDLLAAVYLGNGDTKDAAIQLYINNGTNEQPQYTYTENLKSAGSEIQPYFY